MTPIGKRQRARFIYTKSKKIAKCLYIYTKSQTLCKKQDNLRYVFVHKKQDTLLYAFFMNVLKLEKSMTLCVTWRFYIQKARNFEKKDNLRYVFLYTKSLTLCVTRFFMEFLKLAEGGGIFIHKKQCTLR